MGHSGNQSVDFRIIRGQRFGFYIHLFTRRCYSTVHIQHYDSDSVQSVINNNTAANVRPPARGPGRKVGNQLTHHALLAHVNLRAFFPYCLRLHTEWFSWADNWADLYNKWNRLETQPQQHLPKARCRRTALADRVLHPKSGAGIPGPFLPTLNPISGSTHETKSFVLLGNKAGAVHVLHYRPVP